MPGCGLYSDKLVQSLEAVCCENCNECSAFV